MRAITSPRMLGGCRLVSVGVDHDASTFAVETIRLWWRQVGRHAYPKVDSLPICCDGGGSNGYRVRLWELELARFAARRASRSLFRA